MLPEWIREYLGKDFESQENRMGKAGNSWIRKSKNWMEKFLFGLGAREVKFSKMYFEWSCFAMINGKAVYFSSGDCRYKLMKALLVRSAKSFTDYTGGQNMWVGYNENFEENLSKLVKALTR